MGNCTIVSSPVQSALPQFVHVSFSFFIRAEGDTLYNFLLYICAPFIQRAPIYFVNIKLSCEGIYFAEIIFTSSFMRVCLACASLSQRLSFIRLPARFLLLAVYMQHLYNKTLYGKK